MTNLVNKQRKECSRRQRGDTTIWIGKIIYTDSGGTAVTHSYLLCPTFGTNARFGWYRYDSRFALPIFDDDGEVLRYNVFHVELVIRHAEDTKLYLYDIMNIKKETSIPLEP